MAGPVMAWSLTTRVAAVNGWARLRRDRREPPRTEGRALGVWKQHNCLPWHMYMRRVMERAWDGCAGGGVTVGTGCVGVFLSQG